jgi:hypothetical protein
MKASTKITRFLIGNLLEDVYLTKIINFIPEKLGPTTDAIKHTLVLYVILSNSKNW